MFGFDRRDLVVTWNFFKMNLRDRYLGSRFGMAWAIVNPLLMLSIFTFVFGFVLKVRLPGAETTFGYAIWLISGYGPWLGISESLTTSATSVSSASGLIKNLAFKSEILPVAASLLGLVPLAVGLAFVTILLIIDGNQPTWHASLILIVMWIQFFFVISIGFYLSATNVFLRDLGLVLPNILLVILFFSPIFYALESMPRVVQQVSAFNPFYIIADSYRAVLLHHKLPDVRALAFVAVLSFVISYFSLRYFRRLKSFFDSAL